MQQSDILSSSWLSNHCRICGFDPWHLLKRDMQVELVHELMHTYNQREGDYFFSLPIRCEETHFHTSPGCGAIGLLTLGWTAVPAHISRQGIHPLAFSMVTSTCCCTTMLRGRGKVSTMWVFQIRLLPSDLYPFTIAQCDLFPTMM